MNGLRNVASDRADPRLPASLREHPALVRLRACLQAQQPPLDSVDAVCSHLLAPLCAVGEGAAAMESTAPVIAPTY